MIKTHANFCRALDVNQTEESYDSSTSAANHWGKKSCNQRKEFLGKVHCSAERFLRERGVWESVATVLERHYTMTLHAQDDIKATTTRSKEEEPCVTPVQVPSTTAATTVEQEEDAYDVNDIVDQIVSHMCADDEAVPEPAVAAAPTPLAPTSAIMETASALAKVVSTPSLSAVAETAHAATESMQEPPVMEITMVPNPLFSVPNPLDDIQPDATPSKSVKPDVMPLQITTRLHVQVPSRISVVSNDGSASPNPEQDAIPVSPLSTASPVWSMDEVALVATSDDAREDWECDPLTLLA